MKQQKIKFKRGQHVRVIRSARAREEMRRVYIEPENGVAGKTGKVVKGVVSDYVIPCARVHFSGKKDGLNTWAVPHSALRIIEA